MRDRDSHTSKNLDQSELALRPYGDRAMYHVTTFW